MSIEIKFKSPRLQQLCESDKKLTAHFGAINARKIVRRLNEIEAAESLGMLVHYHIGRCHALTENRHGQFALDVEQPLRLIIAPIFEDGQSWVDWPKIRKILVVEVTDYHDE